MLLSIKVDTVIYYDDAKTSKRTGDTCYVADQNIIFTKVGFLIYAPFI